MKLKKWTPLLTLASVLFRSALQTSLIAAPPPDPLVVTAADYTLLFTPPDIPTSFTYSGAITLGGQLNFGFPQPYTAQVASGVNLAGPITLDQSNPSLNALMYHYDLSPLTFEISGNITDDPNPSLYHSRLLLSAYEPRGPGLVISGTNNTYSTGTVINGIITVAPASSLGAGNVIIANGLLHLTAPSNLAPTRTILIATEAALAIQYDQDPTTFLDPASGGTLALDTLFNTPLDLSKLGNGQMALGSTSAGSYAATTLLPSDHLYRFAMPNYAYSSVPTLTVLHSVLTDINNIPSRAELSGVALNAPNSYSGGTLINGPVYANAPGALGSGDITVGSYAGDYPVLSLNAAGATSPSTHITVNSTLVLGGITGTIPSNAAPPHLNPASTLQLGDGLHHNADAWGDSLPILLNTSNLSLKALGNTTETTGPISFAGLCHIALENDSFDTTTLSAPALTRQANAILLIRQIQPGQAPFSSLNIQLASPPPLVNNMLPPYIQIIPADTRYSVDSYKPSFTTYGPLGITSAQYTTLPTNGGTGTEIVDISPTPINQWGETDPVVVPADATIYALRTNASLLNPDSDQITLPILRGLKPPIVTAPNLNSGPVTLHILSGGLITYSTVLNSMRIEPNLDFGSAEAIIHTATITSGLGMQVTVTGTVNALGGLTKMGDFGLYLTNPASTIGGPITVHDGFLALAAAPLPSADPITLYSATGLVILESMTIDRPLQILAAGNNIYSGGGFGIKVTNGKTLTLTGPISAQNGIGFNCIDGPYSDTPAIVRITSSLTDLTAPPDFVGIAIGPSTILQLDSVVHTNRFAQISGVLSGHGTLQADEGINFPPDVFGPTLPGISPGDAPNDLATLTLQTPASILFQATLFLDLNSNTSDSLLVLGNLILSQDPATAQPFALVTVTPDTPTAALALNFLSPPTANTYTLIQATSITGTFATITGLPDNYHLDYSHPGLLLLTTAPEPATLAFLTFASGVLLMRRRRPTPPKS